MGKKIFLLADDDRDDTDMFCEAIAGIDNTINCICATDGREALNVLSEMPEKPHLIFLDVNMPVMNGWQCIKFLKEDERYRQIPVIIVSTSSNEREREIAAELGALYYFTKPNDFNKLMQVLGDIVANLSDGLTNAKLQAALRFQ